MLFHGPTRETAEARTNAVKKLGEDLKKMKVKMTGRSKLGMEEIPGSG